MKIIYAHDCVGNNLIIRFLKERFVSFFAAKTLFALSRMPGIASADFGILCFRHEFTGPCFKKDYSPWFYNMHDPVF